MNKHRLMSSREVTIFSLGLAIKLGIGPVPLFGSELVNAAWLETNGLACRVGDDWTLTDAGAAAFCRLDAERGEQPSKAAS
jgi:hypothetical protein